MMCVNAKKEEEEGKGSRSIVVNFCCPQEPNAVADINQLINP